MGCARRWPVLALLALAVTLRRGSALRVQGPQPENEEGLYELDDDKRDAAFVSEYDRNLSHVRLCPTIRDPLQLLKPLLVPSLRLAFCYIPKAACTQFKDLFNHLNHLNTTDGFAKDYLKSTYKHFGIDPKTITKENGWKFGIFTRDPALRYLSAFGSTCVADARGHFEHSFECCGPLVQDSLQRPEKLVRFFEKRLMYDSQHGYIAQDDHWVQQVEVFRNCGWDNFNPRTVDFHGSVSDGDVNQQVKEMLMMVNGHEPWMTKLVDKFFPPASVAGHTSPLMDITPEAFYRNRSVLEAVGNLYEDDLLLIPNVGSAFYDPERRKPDWQRQKTSVEDFAKANGKFEWKARKRDAFRAKKAAQHAQYGAAGSGYHHGQR
mmetsp:Transcript_71360/g.159778  ORF Transcript_71360/g.159778 Transcript_71360/m.159778 type:complete len:377 (-) Transcript_71360:117-1247(-)